MFEFIEEAGDARALRIWLQDHGANRVAVLQVVGGYLVLWGF